MRQIASVLFVVFCIMFCIYTAKSNANNTELHQIMQDEGLRLNIYDDHLGYSTIGYGHKLRDSEHFITITKAQAVALLMKDYDEVVKDVRMRYPWATGEVHKVLVNMTYQMGATKVKLFKRTLYSLAFGDYVEASKEMLRSTWASEGQTPLRAKRLSNRILKLG